MTKKELIEAIASQAQLTLRQTEKAFKSTFQAARQALAQDGKVAVPEFGIFTTKQWAARKGRNPATGQEILIPKAIVAAFKPSA